MSALLRGRSLGGLISTALLICAATGCATLQPAPPDNVVAIRNFYPSPPWVQPPEGGPVTGVRARTYFLAGETGKGRFVDGVVRVELSVLEPLEDGTYERQPVHEWRFDVEQARGFRILRPSLAGDSYGFVLEWPRTLNLFGRTIEVTFRYERTDDKVIEGAHRRFIVPTPARFRSRSPWAGPTDAAAPAAPGHGQTPAPRRPPPTITPIERRPNEPPPDEPPPPVMIRRGRTGVQ